LDERISKLKRSEIKLLREYVLWTSNFQELQDNERSKVDDECLEAVDSSRCGEVGRRLMHLVPAPAVRLMKRRVQSRPGVRQEIQVMNH